MPPLCPHQTAHPPTQETRVRRAREEQGINRSCTRGGSARVLSSLCGPSGRQHSVHGTEGLGVPAEPLRGLKYNQPGSLLARGWGRAETLPPPLLLGTDQPGWGPQCLCVVGLRQLGEEAAAEGGLVTLEAAANTQAGEGEPPAPHKDLASANDPGPLSRAEEGWCQRVGVGLRCRPGSGCWNSMSYAATTNGDRAAVASSGFRASLLSSAAAQNDKRHQPPQRRSSQAPRTERPGHLV
ncbi:uncharacterized protein LOC100713788 [Cavia porcellus]|uniref:uncharacterized protein LOC100713788 n=1 Tax=Cavia porcellus TaxID=10141 RepID=UPI002FDF4EE8